MSDANRLGWRTRPDWQRLWPLALGTLLLLLGAFCGWQAWLIANEGSAAFKPGTCNAGAFAGTGSLTESGALVRNRIRA